MEYKVKIDSFEGPLDLLLHLVKELEIDIYDIPVKEITEQYMHYIDAMQKIELNIASEYLVMAATLLHMKSATLLPKKELDEEEEFVYEEDPREQLIQQLIAYRTYKEAAKQLEEKELEESQIYTRAPVQFADFNTPAPVQGEVSIDDMLQALEQVIMRQSWHAPLETTVQTMEVSIAKRMEEILQLVHESKEEIPFTQLFPVPNRRHIVTTFLAVLQLLKNNTIQCRQETHFQPIYIKRAEG